MYLSAIPAFGPCGRLTSYIGSYKFLTDACGVIYSEIAKRPGEMFRVPFIDHWEVVVTGKKYINELAQARDDDLSVQDAVADVLQTEFTMGPPIKYDQYHVGVIGLTMTRNLAARFDDVYDEIASASDDFIQGKTTDDSEEWVSVPVFEAIGNIITRTSSRLFVGRPLCNNADYLDLARNWAMGVFVGAFFINSLPWILKPRRHMKHPGRDALKKTVIERVALDREFGVNRPDRPNDAISWFYDAASQRYSPDDVVDDIIYRIMFMNFSAIHTSTNALTNVLYHLAEHPERYLQPLRNEVEDVVARHGWTKAALREMVKVDSFVHESERMNGISALIMSRKVVNPKGFTFSNGVHLPKDSIVSVANYATHHDDDHYENANTFDGFRFSDIREAAEGYDTIRHQFVHTTPGYVSFGHGRHSCPVLNYDLKLSDACNGVKPPNSWVSIAIVPDKYAHILFRKRKDVEINL
ncbi:hypothetical protein H0H87_004054 [Tephrocybe sp. NHM501043]|nr:hypothetical protein H0H87_004054 [Tephrocybe sp. NHM501043]